MAEETRVADAMRLMEEWYASPGPVAPLTAEDFPPVDFVGKGESGHMQLKDCRITMLFQESGFHLEVHDHLAGVKFLEIHLTPEQTCQAFSRRAMAECATAEVFALEKVGLVQEIQPLEFPMPDQFALRRDTQIAARKADEACPAGWQADHYFGQKSFFTREGAPWARTRIRRWVPLPAEHREA